MTQADVDKLVMKPTSRRRLGKYVILGRIGAGGMGKIYLAFQPGPAGIEKLVVIKRLHSHLTQDKVLVANFLDEARLSMALSHPNIVHTYDVGDVDGRYYMAMEHIDGQNLGAVLRTTKRAGSYPPSTQWGGLFSAVLDGLHAAHVAKDARGRSLNIIHRDISPQNILISYDGGAKLVDFGIAKAAMRINETDAGVLKGKYAYMSPEQCEAKDLDARSDVFSAGVVFWEMLAGRRLYKSSNIVKSIDRILHEAPPTPVSYNADCLPALADIALKALAKKRDDRFASAEAFKDAIDEAMLHAGARYHRSDMQTLMTTSFADVIEAQRAVLDEVLSGNAVPLSDDESEIRARDGDSESEFEVPNLQLKSLDPEPTTPSASLSPLITQDSELASQRNRARVGPSLPNLYPPIGVTVASPTAPWDPTDEAPPDLTPQTAPEVGAPLPPPMPSEDQARARRFSGAALLFLLLIVGSAAFLFFALTTGDEAADHISDAPDPGPTRTGTKNAADDGPKTSGPTPTPQRDAALVPGRSNSSATPSGASADPAEAKGPPHDAVPSAPPTATKSAAKSAAAKPVASTSPSTKRKTARPTKRTGRDRRGTRTASTNAPRATGQQPDGDGEAKAAPKPAVDEDAKRRRENFGFLTLDTVPWTTVYLDGQRLGNTPLAGVKVPAGELKLILKNRSENIEKTYYVNVKKGATTRKRLGLK